MGRIIVAVPNTMPGGIALNHLRNQSRSEFGAPFESTLGEALSKQALTRERPQLDEVLNHTYVSLRTSEGTEFATLDKILRFHSDDQARSGFHGFVECGDIDRPMRSALTPPKSGRIGTPLDLGTASGKHSDYLNLLNLSSAHSKGKNVRVAVIDTGIDNSVTPSPVSIAEYHDIVNDMHYTSAAPIPFPTLSDMNGHGSAMAMIIAEVAPDAEFNIIKICDDDPTLWNAMAGLGQALYGGAQVISFAFGFKSTGNLCCTCGTSSKTQSDVFKVFLENIANLDPTQGLRVEPPIVVTPTGNERSGRGFLYPAGYMCVFAVGSIDRQRTRSLFSNYGMIHSSYFMAPGGQEDSAGTITEYVGRGPSGAGAEFYGTSPAVAYAAGMVALIRSASNFTYTDRAAFVDRVLTFCSPKPTNVNQQQEYGEGVISF